MIDLIHGNAMDVLERLRPDVRFDAVITDPPYSSGAATLAGKTQATSKKYTDAKGQCKLPDFEGDAMDQRSWSGMMCEVLRIARRHANPGAVIAMFVDWRQLPILTDTMQWAGWIWRGIAVWDKKNCRPQKGRFKQQAEFIVWGSNGPLPVDRPVPCLPGVFEAANVSGSERIHQTQKPVELMRQVVRLCVPGGKVLDMFCGSASTLVAASMEGYSAVGIEVHDGIYEAAKGRLEALGCGKGSVVGGD